MFNKYGKNTWIFILLITLFLLIFCTIFSFFTPSDFNNPNSELLYSVLILIFTQISACIFFPLVVGKIQSELSKEYLKAGIKKVYRDRGKKNEIEDREENAENDIIEDFKDLNHGTIKIIGVSLRDFFHERAPYYDLIKNLDKNIEIQALFCDSKNSYEVINRGMIEDPNATLNYINTEDINSIEPPQIIIDIENTRMGIEKLVNKSDVKTNIKYKQYKSAPYCTAIIFPNKCYFSPNVLSPNKADGLPMIQYKANSNTYKVLLNYFSYIWNYDDSVENPYKTTTTFDTEKPNSCCIV